MKLVLLEDVRTHLPRGFMSYQIYGIYVKKQEVGRLVYREGTDEQRYYDGHIAYHIEEQYRGHHYAYYACLLLKENISKDHLIITCDPYNMASIKTIEKLNSEYLETKKIPASWKRYFTKDEKEKRIYRWYMR